MASGNGRPFGRRNRKPAPYQPPTPGEGNLVQTKVRLHLQVHEALHARAAQDGISVNAYIARLIAKDVGLPDPVQLPVKDQGVMEFDAERPQSTTAA